jgi:3-oxoacyl-[acyl-carrier protein] reductase
MDRLQGRTALITGAARGIGRAMALRFAAEGCALALCDMNLAAVEDTAAQARALGVAALAAQVDVTSREQVQALVDNAAAQPGGIDILANNAGIFFNADFDAMTDHQWQQMIDTNLTSVFRVSQIVIRYWLQAHKSGTIINLASISASIAFTGSAHYCAAKAGVAALTRCIALEYGPRGIRANSIAPGIIDTPMLPDPQEARAWGERLPLRRMGTPEDVADVALFLASDESRYITGDMIYIDGGWMLE